MEPAKIVPKHKWKDAKDGDNDSGEIGIESEEEDGEMDLTYPTNNTKRRLSIRWKRAVADFAIDAKTKNDPTWKATAVRKVWPNMRDFSPKGMAQYAQ